MVTSGQGIDRNLSNRLIRPGSWKSMSTTVITDHPLTSGIAPDWASEWGHDAFGPWCAFQFLDARQVKRWIPPGQFQMGAPETEEGRFPEEAPPHWVTLSNGFWMFDSPCPQLLFKRVMDWNRSEFAGDDHPVENVPWFEADLFCTRLRKRSPEFVVSLPTAAQWEYACRAGSPAARYGKLDEIAWHDGNGKGQTHPVKQKKPNAWGLYDMLGNVMEWCRNGPDPIPQQPAVGFVRHAEVAYAKGGSVGIGPPGI